MAALNRMRPHAALVDNKPTHKNLYVLNLPLDASTDQLTALFSSYGTVVHCVILAMLDAQARRRGFIDMSGPKEAKEAIEGLNGFVWHGYPIEVSYAIVQRSGGPFDQVTGRSIIKRNVPRNRFNTGPRRVPSDSAMAADYYGNEVGAGLDQLGGGAMNASYGMAPFGGGNGGLTGSSYLDGFKNLGPDEEGSATDPFTIFIAGLDPVAIIDDDDFRQAVRPYGTITAATLCRDENGTSRGFGIVTFTNQDEASRACEDLNGKIVNGRRMSAHKYVYQTQTHPALVRAGLPFVNGGNASSLPTPMSLPRRSVGPSSGPNLTYTTTDLLQALPQLNNTRLTPRSAQANTMWPPSPRNASTLNPTSSLPRLDQIPMGSIGAAGTTSSIDKWNPSSTTFRTGATTPSFFQMNNTSRPVEIKPDLRQVDNKVSQQLQGHEKSSITFDKQLGDAFMPMPKSNASSDRCSESTNNRENDGEENKLKSILSNASYTPSNTASNGMSLLRTPGSTNGSWVKAGSHGLDAMSPESISSAASSPMSQLNTPEAVRGADSTTIWGPTSAAHDRMNASIHSSVSPSSWLSNAPSNNATEKQRVTNMTGSAILALQNTDMVESKSHRNNGNNMAPVGHEKTSSSPLRVMRPFKEEGELDVSNA